MATVARTGTARAVLDAEMTTAGAALVVPTAIADPVTVRDQNGTAVRTIAQVRIVGDQIGTAVRTMAQVRIVGDQIGADPNATAAGRIAAGRIAAVRIVAGRIAAVQIVAAPAVATGRGGRTGAMRRIAVAGRTRDRAIRGRPAARSGSLTRCCPMM
jgi:hypothetical protein